MNGDNPSGADNQQERPGFEQWVVGFVDGEGCFTVPIFKNRTTRLGWQVQPEFVVVQGARSSYVLYEVKEFFGCGSVGINRRFDDHREDMYRYSVKRLADLTDRIIPFFEEHPLRTAKYGEFEKFVEVVGMMVRREHLTQDGLERIASIAETMNNRKRSRFLESSEAIRQPTLLDVKS